jgi:hypothetical protein
MFRRRSSDRLVSLAVLFYCYFWQLEITLTLF